MAGVTTIGHEPGVQRSIRSLSGVLGLQAEKKFRLQGTLLKRRFFRKLRTQTALPA